MKLIHYFFTLNFLLTVPCHGGPIIIGNGAGLVEMQTVFVWKNIHKFIQICRASPACKLDSKSALVLTETLQKPRAELIFISGKTAPNLILKDSQSELLGFGTKGFAPSQVYINTDKLYENISNKKHTISDSINLLTAAIAYQSKYSVQDSIKLGKIVGEFWNSKIQESNFKTTQDQSIQLALVVQNNLPQIILLAKDQFNYLNPEINLKLSEFTGENSLVQLTAIMSPYLVEGLNNQVSLVAKIEFLIDKKINFADVAISFNLNNIDKLNIQFYNIEPQNMTQFKAPQ